MSPWPFCKKKKPKQPPYSCELNDSKYYRLCAGGGILATGIPHLALTPVDMVKCRMQLDPSRYAPLIEGLRRSYYEGGRFNIVRGWLPTLIGYSLHGAVKFPSYELFKYKYSKWVGEERAYRYRSIVFLAAGASAEIIATTFLAPFEHMKIRIQTMPYYTNRMQCTYTHILGCEGWQGFFRGLAPLLLRQVPLTMMNCLTFEKSMDLIYKCVVPKPREKCSKVVRLAVAFIAGYISGVLCAVVSHPADTIVTRLYNSPKTSAKYILRNHSERIWLGLGPRILMIGTISGLQWFIFDWFKDHYNMPPPEASSSPKGKGHT